MTQKHFETYTDIVAAVGDNVMEHMTEKIAQGGPLTEEQKEMRRLYDTGFTTQEEMDEAELLNERLFPKELPDVVRDIIKNYKPYKLVTLYSFVIMIIA